MTRKPFVRRFLRLLRRALRDMMYEWVSEPAFFLLLFAYFLIVVVALK